MKKIFTICIIILFSLTSISLAKTIKKYYPNGKIKSIVKYNKKGAPVGHYRIYWPNGKVKEEGNYKKGRITYPIKRYTVDGLPLDQ